MWTKTISAAVRMCLLSVFAVGQSVYTVTNLGPISPTAINSWAQVVGNYNNQAYIWTLGHSNSLGIPPGGTFSSAAAINDLGVVAGTADGPGTAASPYSGIPNELCANLIQPVTWKQGHIQTLGTIGFQEGLDWCGYPFHATALNDFGQVVGYTSQYPNEYQFGFLWTNGASSNLPVTFFLNANNMGLFGGTWPPTIAESINDAGEIVGQDGYYFELGHAGSWQNSAETDLGSLAMGGSSPLYSSSANDVNILGQAVGWSTTGLVESTDSPCYEPNGEACVIHAVLWASDGTITDLGTIAGDSVSAAAKINDFGFVIGASGTKLNLQGSGAPLQVSGRPFVWSQGTGMQDLNTLIPRNSGWILNSVSDINVWGQIVGTGTFNGKPRGFLLTPRNPFRLGSALDNKEEQKILEDR